MVEPALPRVMVEEAKTLLRLLKQCAIAERYTELTQQQMWARIFWIHVTHVSRRRHRRSRIGVHGLMPSRRPSRDPVAPIRSPCG